MYLYIHPPAIGNSALQSVFREISSTTIYIFFKEDKKRIANTDSAKDDARQTTPPNQ